MMDKMLSILLFSYQSEDKLFRTSKVIIDKMEEENIPFELIIIDDGSKDDSWSVAQSIAESDSRISCYALSKNYGVDMAQYAGMEVCKGACVVTVPDDLERPIENVVQMYRAWEDGNKIIMGVRASRKDGLFTKIASSIYFKCVNFVTDLNIPKGGVDGYMIDREIIEIMKSRVSPTHSIAKIELLRLGYDPVFIEYHRPKLNEKSRWTLRKKVNMFSDTIFSITSFPIRIITILGLLIFIVCIILITLIFIAKVYTDSTLFGLPIPGWATIVTFVTLFNGLILFCLGVVAEYIWRIYEEVKDRPAFLIKDKK